MRDLSTGCFLEVVARCGYNISGNIQAIPSILPSVSSP